MNDRLNDWISQSINHNLYSSHSRSLLRLRSQPRPSGKGQSRKGGGIENRLHLGGTLDILEVHSGLLDQPQEKNVWNSGRKDMNQQSIHSSNYTVNNEIKRNKKSKDKWKGRKLKKKRWTKTRQQNGLNKEKRIVLRLTTGHHSTCPHLTTDRLTNVYSIRLRLSLIGSSADHQRSLIQFR